MVNQSNYYLFVHKYYNIRFVFSFLLDHFGGVVLNHDHRVLFIGRNHDLVLARPDSDESDLLVGVHLLDGSHCLVLKVHYQRPIEDGLFLRHGCLDGNTLIVDD